MEQMTYTICCGAEGCDTEPEERRCLTTSLYRRDGQLAEYRYYNPDGSHWVSLYTYDALGRLCKVEDTSGWTSVYHYDHLGRLERIITETIDGKQHTSEPFCYDKENRKSRTLHMERRAVGSEAAAAYCIEGTDAAYSAPRATSMTTYYNECDQPTEVLFRDSEDRVVSRVTLIYDAEGHLLEESQTAEIREFPPAEALAQLSLSQSKALEALWSNFQWRRVHTYDAQGRRVETRSFEAPFGGDRKTVTYNEHGDPSEERWYLEHKRFTIDEDGSFVEQVEPTTTPIDSETRFTYTYDEQGNWTERVTSVRQQRDRPYRVSSIDRRILTYYQD